jgi:hypothetical protein
MPATSISIVDHRFCVAVRAQPPRNHATIAARLKQVRRVSEHGAFPEKESDE